MSIDHLVFAGRSPATEEFNRLVDRHRELVRVVRETEKAQNTAAREANRLLLELEALERQRSAGHDVAAKVKSAEKALTVARVVAAEPWAERVRGATAGVRDAAGTVGRFAAANYHALAAELREDAEDSKTRCDAVLDAIADAHREREDISQRFTTLAALVGLREPQLVFGSRLEPVVRAAESVLMAGGERAPIARRDPIEEAVA